MELYQLQLCTMYACCCDCVLITMMGERSGYTCQMNWINVTVLLWDKAMACVLVWVYVATLTGVLLLGQRDESYVKALG